jgi:hypothetical protein
MQRGVVKTCIATKKDPVARAVELAIFTFVSTATGGVDRD